MAELWHMIARTSCHSPVLFMNVLLDAQHKSLTQKPAKRINLGSFFLILHQIEHPVAGKEALHVDVWCDTCCTGDMNAIPFPAVSMIEHNWMVSPNWFLHWSSCTLTKFSRIIWFQQLFWVWIRIWLQAMAQIIHDCLYFWASFHLTSLIYKIL